MASHSFSADAGWPVVVVPLYLISSSGFVSAHAVDLSKYCKHVLDLSV